MARGSIHSFIRKREASWASQAGGYALMLQELNKKPVRAERALLALAHTKHSTSKYTER